MYENSKVAAESEDKMLAWAESYLNLHKDVEREYIGKYDQYKISTIAPQKLDGEALIASADINRLTVEEVPVEETDIFKELKAYPLDKSREEGIKPYFI